MKPFFKGCGLLAIQLSAVLQLSIPGVTSKETYSQDIIVSAKITRQLNEMIQAYQIRDPNRFVSVSKDLLNRAGKDGLQKINQELKQRKLPTVEQMVARVRIDATKSNVNLPAPSWNEFRGIVPQVVELTQNAISSYEKKSIGGAEVTAPSKFAEYEDWIWDLHVFRNRFNVLKKVAIETEQLKKKFSRQIDKHRKQFDEVTANQFAIDLSATATKFDQMIQAIDEREAEIRVLRIDDANDLVLAGKQFSDQFEAAFALAFDQLFFQEFFAKAKREQRKFKNSDLNDETILEIVHDLVDSAKTANPSLFEKAKLFYVASHWWLRGRYGQGPLADGLLKAKDAGKDESTLFPLFMPVNMPNIDQLVGDQPAKPVVRRHEFVWSLGNEGIESMSMDTGKRKAVVAQLDRFYWGYNQVVGLVNSQALPNLVNLKIEDESLLPRIVGFYEYHNALKLFDKLAAISTEEEMKVYDEALKNRPEFSIYVGRPKTAQLGPDRVVFQQAFKQTGMAWVTALARVELGAMIAAFSEKESPFSEVAPTKYDSVEFNQLLSEGWASHLLGIQRLAKINESVKGKLAPGVRGGAIVKIARRSKVASDMVVVAAGTLNPATSEGKYEQLQSEYDQLQQYRDQLASQLKAEISRARSSVKNNSGWQTGHIPSCARGGVEAALADGRFSTKSLK